MEKFPYPPLPTEQEILAETECIRRAIFFAPPVLLAAVIFVGLLTMICIAYNFNPLNWLE